MTHAAVLDRSRCVQCGTELPPHALACPACASLVHAERLKQFAAVAEAANSRGDLVAARDAWESALRLLPAGTQQTAIIRERVANLTSRVTEQTPGANPPPADAPWWRRGAAAIVTVAVLLIGKLKFLLLGLTKASTLFSMFAYVGWYWSMYSWPLAVGLVVAIYIHEMGHVAMLRRLGIASGAPLFVPGFGAFVMLKQHVDDPIVDAKIGLAGPVWGLGAALVAYAAYAYTHVQVWFAIAELTALLNLFNLIPFWQLDGSRGMHALSRAERWVVVAALGIAWYLTGLGLLFIVAAVAVWRALQRQVGPGHTRSLATFVVLVTLLAWLAKDFGHHVR